MDKYLGNAVMIAALLIPASPLLAPAPVRAQDSQASQATAHAAAFTNFLQSLRPRALMSGISAASFDAVVPTLSFNPRVIALDQAQPGGPPNSPIPDFEPYRARHVDAARIARGQERYQALRGQLARIEAETGVPEAIMIAIYGHETNYGAYSGNFDLLRSLASLAFEGRRRALFTEEFLATLTLLDQGVPREHLVGSWAGATGYPQFLPSAYLKFGKDGDGDGKVDIWTNEIDALSSIANYLRHAGWRPGVRWGVKAVVPEALDRTALRNRIAPPRCERVLNRHSRYLSLAEWRARGMVPVEAPGMAETTLLSLLEPDGPGRPAYLLSVNYRAILDYNCSNFYALSVGLLADAVMR